MVHAACGGAVEPGDCQPPLGVQLHETLQFAVDGHGYSHQAAVLARRGDAVLCVVSVRCLRLSIRRRDSGDANLAACLSSCLSI